MAVGQGKILKKQISEKGLSVDEAARKLGKSRQTLQVYFNQYKLRDDVVKSVKTLLGIELPPIEENKGDPPEIFDKQLRFLEDQIQFYKDQAEFWKRRCDEQEKNGKVGVVTQLEGKRQQPTKSRQQKKSA